MIVRDQLRKRARDAQLELIPGPASKPPALVPKSLNRENHAPKPFFTGPLGQYKDK